MRDPDHPSEGHVRRGRTVIVGALGLGLLVALPFLSAVLGRDDGPEPAPEVTRSTVPATALFEKPLRGRLAYMALDPEREGHLRIWVWDLESGTVTEGPAIPIEYSPVQSNFALYASGPRREWLVLLRFGPSTVAYLLRDLGADAGAIEAARADGVAVSSDRLSLLTLEEESGRAPGCRDPAFRLYRLDLATGALVPAFRGPLPCGSPFGFALLRSTPVVGIAEEGSRSPRTYLLRPHDPEPLFRGPYPFAAAAGNVFFADTLSREGMFVWPGGGAPRPVLPGSKVIGRVLAISDGGRYVAVAGTVDGVAAVWVLDASAGVVRLGIGDLPSISDTLGVTFASDGTAFVVSWEGVLAESGGSVRSLQLPTGAPEPRGAVAWLP